MKRVNLKAILFGVVWAVAIASPLSAQHAASDAEALKQANNPLASIKSFNVHNYYSPSLYEAPDASTNLVWLRYAQPLGSFLVRASMPFITIASPDAGPKSGLYDANIFLIYKFKMKNEGMELGIGPAFTFPTATRDLGSGKWQTGFSAIAFFKENSVLQAGSLINWQISFAGDEDKSDVNLLTPQLFFLWQLGAGTYLRSTGAWSFDLEKGYYNIPIGLGLGKVVKVGGSMFNIFLEPQYSVYAYGGGQPKLQLFAGFNVQFH